MIKIIVAVSENNVIGLNNSMPWREPNDLKYFKKMTEGSVIIMGRKTFESLPKMLPNRKHVVISRTLEHNKEFSVFDNLESALKIYPNCFIIGGGEIYKQSLPLADELYLTEVGGEYEGDTFFSEIPSSYKLVDSEKEGNLTFKLYKNDKQSR